MSQRILAPIARFTVFTLLLLSTLTPNLSFADGMYVVAPHKLPKEAIAAAGVKLSTDEIEKFATSAIASLGEFCSSTFLSNDGLIGTNWHCAKRCLNAVTQKAKSERGEQDPIAMIGTTGFIAKSPEEELVCPGLYVNLPLEVTNITTEFADIRDNKALSPKETLDQIKEKKEKIRTACRGDDKDIVCNIAFMNNDANPYYLYKMRRISDVRLVWVPPSAIGFFGGETDNWEYPRHNGDFTFMRVYNNGTPYHPAAFARVSTKGVKPNDVQFMLGFPGSTQRNITSAEAEFLQNVFFRRMYDYYSALAGVIEQHYPKVSDTPYESSWFYLANYIKNSLWKADLMESENVVANIKAREDEQESKSYLPELEKIFRDRYYYYPTLYLLGLMTGGASPAKSLQVASDIYNWSTQPSDDKQRNDERYKSWNQGKIRAGIVGMDDQFQLDVEKSLMAKYFELADALTVKIGAIETLKAKTQQIVADCYAAPDGKSGDGKFNFAQLCRRRGATIYTQMAEVLYAGTTLVARDGSAAEKQRAQAARLAMFEGKTPQALVDSRDSLILLAKGLNADIAKINGDWELGANYGANYETMNHLRNVAQRLDTPDANATLRFSLSTVQPSYDPIFKEGHFGYSSTVTSLMERHGFVSEPKQSDYEYFQVPEAIRKVVPRIGDYKGTFFFADDLNDVPVNYITQHVLSGGSSGSGVFNINGELVGFAFDGTPESVLSDVQLHPQSRAIIVDIRYVGFLGSVVYPDAKWILKELGLPRI